MGPDKRQLLSIVSSSKSSKEDSAPHFTVETAEQDDNGSLQKMTFQPRRYFYAKYESREAP
jgi:hypothetical protein